MTTFGQLLRLLATAAFLLLAVPAWAQDDTEPAATGQTTADIEARAKALMAEGRHVDALSLLGPLVEVRPIIMDVYFLVGLASIGAAGAPDASAENREAFLDIAVRTFRAMLVRNPGLVRVRLELARAYFLQGEDAEAKEHFERVLAGENPEAVVANVSRYLSEIRKRKRWSSYFGFALAPDSNIGAASDDRTINIFGLPFERDQQQLTSSGIGLSVWGGGEYQYPLRDRVRLRVGGDISRQEYSGSEFDRMTLSAHVGPRWLIGNRSRASVLAIARHHRRINEPYADDLGFNTEVHRRFTLRTTGTLRTSWVERRHDGGGSLDGPRTSISLSLDRVLTPTLQGNLTLGWAGERTDREDRRNTSRWLQLGMTKAFAGGLTVSGGTTFRWTDYEGNWFPFTDGEPREDLLRSYRVSGHHRAISWRGFSPKISLVFEERSSNAQLHDYERTFGELTLVRVF